MISISDTKFDNKWEVLTSHQNRDRHQRTGDVQCEPSTVGDECIEDDSERLPAANHAERNQCDHKVHRHGSLQVHSDDEKRKQEARGDLERYLENEVYEEERVDRVCPVCVLL